MTTPFTKKELRGLIASTEASIDNLNKSPTVTVEESESKLADLQKLNSARSELLEKTKVAPE